MFGINIEKITLFNTFLGILNYQRNLDQEKTQKIIMNKLDFIIKKMEKEK